MPATLQILVAPRASRNKVLGMHDGAVKIALTEPPVDGKANKALVACIAKLARVPRKSVRIVAGETSKRKRIEVDGLEQQELIERLLGATKEP